ncbi:hypothetical protein BHF71_10580 [Vulcanibacillus modesticaldus]|uniref:Uncharacterized protein n=1 Tax=Vulcanibacillus modesticaldus TaxID=337097 RepID=A0A1D2YTD0_9BACI|nr:hypothetical protein [Vulcanibacillus modesticaldus]OEF98948.1 hypothetical protein BHF71_10580 [Vulcanibacillus modesticaldus]
MEMKINTPHIELEEDFSKIKMLSEVTDTNEINILIHKNGSVIVQILEKGKNESLIWSNKNIKNNNGKINFED